MAFDARGAEAADLGHDTSRLRVAYVYRYYRRSGSIASLFARNADAMAARVQLTAVCSTRDRAASAPGVRFLDVEPAIVGEGRFAYAAECASFAIRSGRLLRRNAGSLDVVHVEGFASTWADVVTLHAVRRSEIDHYFTHIEPNARLRRRLSPIARPQNAAVLELERRLLRGTPRPLVVCPSRAVADDVVRWHRVPPEDVHVIPYGVDLRRLRAGVRDATLARESVGTPDGRLVLLVVATSFERKGVGRAIAALARCSADAELWVIGGEDPARYQRQAREAGIGDRVRFLGSKPADELPAWYAAADFVLVLSSQDSWALTVSEALASGAVVVASRFCGAFEAIHHGETGFVVEGAGDPAAVAALVDSSAMADPARRAAMREAALVSANSFDVELTYRSLLDLYQEANERNRPSKRSGAQQTVPHLVDVEAT